MVEGDADHLFVGDTLFAGSVGRTDLENTGGDFNVLSNSIRTKLWPLDPTTIVHPGHGPLTTIGHEKATNPFVVMAPGSLASTRSENTLNQVDWTEHPGKQVVFLPMLLQFHNLHVGR